jgi:hypothetical protein
LPHFRAGLVFQQTLSDLDEAKEQAGFWSILRITELIAKMRALLRGGASSNG